MKLWTFIKSPSGNVAVFAGFILLGGFMVFRSHARDQARAEQMAQVEETAPDVGRQSILRDGSPLKVPETFTPASRESSGTSRESRPRAARERTDTKPPAALPISLFTSSATSDATELSKTYAPYGRMIPCETVVTIESSRLDTPVIGLVTEDVWHDGRLIIPAGAEVHGRASLDRSRERIAVAGRRVGDRAPDESERQTTRWGKVVARLNPQRQARAGADQERPAKQPGEQAMASSPGGNFLRWLGVQRITSCNRSQA